MGEGKRYRWEGEGKPEGVRGREMIQKTDGKGTRNRRDVEERKRYRRWMGRGWGEDGQRERDGEKERYTRRMREGDEKWEKDGEGEDCHRGKTSAI